MSNQTDDLEKATNGKTFVVSIPIAEGGDGGEWEVTRLEPHWARALQALPPLKAGVRRNDPCPCGSGKKFKRCCR